jgi:hypothetical protein
MRGSAMKVRKAETINVETDNFEATYYESSGRVLMSFKESLVHPWFNHTYLDELIQTLKTLQQEIDQCDA